MANIYKRDMERYVNGLKKRKKIMWAVISATTVLLALSIIITAVGGLFYVDWGEAFSFDWLAGLGEDGESDDVENPVIKPVSDTTVIYTGTNVSYRNLVKATDNSGSCELEFDASGVKQNTVGTYTVKYTATDAAGNVGTLELTVHVKDGTYTEEKLMTLIAQKAKAELGYTKEEAKTQGLTKTQIVKDIYMYVKDPTAGPDSANIKFNDAQSNTPNQLSQNGKKHRDGWETDWIEEAYRTLTMSRMVGDCYTYYSVSKAFFEYFEIENLGIERSPSSSISGTHYWNIVNIGTESSPVWYYYDSTRLGGTFSGYASGYKAQNSCFMTEAKMRAYVTSKGSSEFYTVDKWSGFPTISTKEIEF